MSEKPISPLRQRMLEAAPGPGLKYKAALSIAYGAGLRARGRGYLPRPRGHLARRQPRPREPRQAFGRTAEDFRVVPSRRAHLFSRA